MHIDEKWQLYAPNGEPISGVGWDSALDNPEGEATEIVGIAVVFLYRFSEKGELEFLWQKRSKNVNRFAGYYDISAGGHINLGESVAEGAVRECHEEIGVKVAKKDLQFVTMRPFNKNRFAWIYAVDWTGKPDKFKFNDNEVSEVKWVPYVKLEDFRKKYLKPALREDSLTFAFLKEWLKMHELI